MRSHAVLRQAATERVRAKLVLLGDRPAKPDLVTVPHRCCDFEALGSSTLRSWLPSLGCGERELEARTFTGPTERLDRAAMRERDAFCDREAEAGATLAGAT